LKAELIGGDTAISETCRQSKPQKQKTKVEVVPLNPSVREFRAYPWEKPRRPALRQSSQCQIEKRDKNKGAHGQDWRFVSGESRVMGFV
jgi:hypothetical protein